MKQFDIFYTMIKIPIDSVMLLLAAILAYSLRLSDWAVQKREVLFAISLEEYVVDILTISLFLLKIS